MISISIEKGFSVSIRPHPNEKVETYDILKDKYGDKIKIDNGIDFLEWLNSCKIIVATKSTSLTEAYLLKKSIVCIDKMLSSDHMAKYDSEMKPYDSICYTPENIGQFESYLDSDLSPRTHNDMDDFLLRHYNLKEADDIGFDALFEIANVLHKNHPPKSRSFFTKLITSTTYSSLDFLSLIWYILCGRWKVTRIYDYSPLLHTPSVTIKRIARDIRNDRDKAN